MAAFVLTKPWNFREFLAWITYHSPDSAFRFGLLQNTWLSLRGHLRLILGGKLGNVRDGFEIVPALLAVAIAGSAVAMWRRHGPGMGRTPAPARSEWVRAAAVWVSAFIAFLFVWLPQNTFYRVLYVPALALLAGAALRTWSPGRRAAGVVATMALWNLLAFIYPHSRIEANLPLAFAESVRADLPKGSIVYLKDFHADAWLLWYVNPQVILKQLRIEQVPAIEAEIAAVEAAGATAWAETSLLHALESDSEGSAWLRDHSGPLERRIDRPGQSLRLLRLTVGR
jgi:hypothetical protein